MSLLGSIRTLVKKNVSHLDLDGQPMFFPEKIVFFRRYVNYPYQKQM